MANVVEILLVVRDLASSKLDAASKAMEQNLAGVRREADKAGVSVRQYDDNTQRAASHSAAASRDLARVSQDLAGAERALSRLGGATEGLPEDVERHVQALRQEKTELENVNIRAGRLEQSVSRLGAAVKNTVLSHLGFSRTLQDNDRDAVTFERRLVGLERGFRSILGVGGLIPAIFGGIRRGFQDFTRGAAASEEEAAQMTGTLERMGAGFSSLGSSLPAVSFGFLKIFAIVTLVATAIPLLSGGILALSGAVGALAASLGSLLAVAVAIPAAFAAIGGILAAVLTIIKPAVSGILGAVEASDKAKEAGGGGAAAAGGDPVKAAEQSLAATRKTGALQVKRLEQELKQARLDAIFRVRDAERGLQQAREQAFVRLIDLERQLSDLRSANAAQRSQLEQALANAQAQQQADAARGGGHGALTKALVGEAQSDLDAFNKQAATSEKDLTDQIVQQRQDGIRQIQAAEENLQQTRIDNINHIADLENSLKQTRIQNAQQERAAEQALQQARTGGAAGSIDAVAEAYKNLSPLQRKIAGEILTIKDRWKGLTAGFRDRFLQEADKDLQAIDGHLPAIAKGIGGFADVITNTFRRAREAFNDKSFTGAFSRDVQDATDNADLFSRAGINLGKTMVFLVDAAKPLLDFISKTALAWSKQAEAATKAGDANGKLSGFFERVRDRLKLVLDIVGNLAGAFFNIGKIAAPFGDILLRQFDRFTQKFQTWTGSRKGKSEIRDFFKDAIPAAESVIGFVDKLVGALAGLGRDFIRGGAQSPLAKIFDTLSAGIGPLATAIGNIAKASGPGLATLITDLARLLETFSKHTAGITLMLTVLDELVKFIDFVANAPLIGPILGSILTPIALFAAAFPKAAFEVSKFFLVADASGTRGFGRLIGGFKDAAKKIGGAFSKVGEALAGPLRTVSLKLLDFSKTALTNMESAARRVGGLLAKAGTAAIDFGKKCLTALGNLAKLTFEFAVNGLKAIATWIFEISVAALTAIGEFIAAMIVATASAIGFDIAISANPIGIAIIAIVALIAIVVLLAKHWRQVADFLLGLWDDLRKAAGAAFGAIVHFVENHWKDLIAFFLGPVGFLYLLLKFTGLWDDLKHVAKVAWDAITGVVTAAFHGIVNFFTNTAPGLLKRAFGAAWDGVASVTTAAFDGIKSTVRNFVNDIIDAANWVLDHIGLGRPIPKWTESVKQLDPHAAATRAAEGWIGSEAVGSIVPATPGGLLHIVEAGHPEAVLSLDPKFKDRTLEIIAEVLRRLGFHDPKKGLFEAIARARAVARDLLPDASITSFARGGIARLLGAMPMAGGGVGSGGSAPIIKAATALREAVRIDNLNLDYLWGGGHQSSPAPDDGPFDCSGFVSHILQHVGLLGPTEVSGALARYGDSGFSKVIGILANDGHVYMDIMGKFYGTSSNNPGGGPGLLDYGIREGFALRHPHGFPAGGDSGVFGGIADAITGGAGLLASVAGKVFHSVAEVADWIRNKLPSFPHLPGMFGKLPGQLFGWVTDKFVDYAKSKVPFFADGGTVGGPQIGAPVPAVVHVGEWILNHRHIGRLASALGGVENARSVVFGHSQALNPTRQFAGGGIVTGSSTVSQQRTVQQSFEIKTTSPKVDIDYVMRIAEQRMLGTA